MRLLKISYFFGGKKYHYDIRSENVDVFVIFLGDIGQSGEHVKLQENEACISLPRFKNNNQLEFTDTILNSKFPIILIFKNIFF